MEGAVIKKKRRDEVARKEPTLGVGWPTPVVASTSFLVPRPVLSGGAPAPRPPGPIVCC